MNLDWIIIREAPDQYESLALALQAIAAADDVELDYDDLCAALGVSFSAVSTTAEPSPGWWLTYGRDAFVKPAARLFGLELRALHPPNVSVDMLAADEFPQHYEASYKPLIRAALENGQPVLAWQGWPDYRWPFWGVITAQAGSDFDGTTLWTEGRRQRLTGPAKQCYMVEACDPAVPRPAHLLAMAMQHADAYMNRGPFACVAPGAEAPAIVTGPAGFDAWEQWLQSDDFGDPSEDPSWNEHRQHAEFIAAARQSAARFLRRFQLVVDEDRARILGEAAACCDSLVSRLADSRDQEKARILFASRPGRRTLLQAVNAAEADDRRLAMHLEQLV